MTLSMRWTPRALRRLDEIGDFIATDNPPAAERVIARLVSLADKLGERPAMGRPGRIKGTRELVFTDIPYIIPYRVTATTIDLLTIMHTSQCWPEKL